MDKKEKLKFRKWVDEFGGIEKVAAQYNVLPHTVRAWLRGENTPTVQIIMGMIVVSRTMKTKLNFDIIYKECTRNKTK